MPDSNPETTGQVNSQPPASTATVRSSFPLPEEVVANHLEAATVLAAELAVTEARDVKAVLLHEIGEIDERVRNDEVAAAKSYLPAYNQRPTFHPPLEGLIRLYARRRNVANLAKLQDALVKAATTPREKADALVLRGELLEDRVGDARAARTEYERAIEADPDCRIAWLDLERQALREGDRALALQVLRRLAELTTDPDRKARLLLDLATEHAREGQGDADEAAFFLRQAAELPTGRWRALVELERFGERTGRPEDVVLALEGRAALAQEVARGQDFQGGSGAFSIARLASAEVARDQAADLWTRAARLRLTALHDAEGARSAMDQALALRPEDPRYRYVAMVLADESGELDRASALAGWLLEAGFGDPFLKASLHFRTAEAAAVAGNLEAAAQGLRAALEANPESVAARGALMEQLVASGDGAQAVQEWDRLAEAETDPARRGVLRRVGAAYALALADDADGALQRFRLACEDVPGDVVSRRALVTLLSRRSGDEEVARALVAAITALLPQVVDADERVALLLKRLTSERYVLGDLRAAAQTAEELVKATGDEPWALECAALTWAAAGVPDKAARWAEVLAARSDLPGGAGDATGWRAAAARWLWASGNATRARELAVAAQKQDPADPYLAGLALRLALAGGDPALALDVATRKADASEPEVATRWLLLAGVLLSDAGAGDLARSTLEAAAERSPGSPGVRAALLEHTRWHGDNALRTRIAEAALEGEACTAEEVALGVELALLRAFVEHDVPGAVDVLGRVAARDGGTSPAVGLLHAIACGAYEGPDAESTLAALQEALQSVPSDDPLRIGLELEVARALGASSATQDQAAAARELVDGDRPHLVAPRLLAMLDAIQREERDLVPPAFDRLAEFADAPTAAALRGVAMASQRARGHGAEARAMALKHPDLPASVVTLSETAAGLEQAHDYAAGLARRAGMAAGAARATCERAAASWSSLAGEDQAALAGARALLARDPGDLVALDVQRVTGRRLEQWALVAAACEALGKLTHNPERAAVFSEEAGVVALDDLADPRRAERNLQAALEGAPSRLIAYRKYREVLEARKDVAGLEALVTRRLPFIEDDAELIELHWEQARLRRALGRREAALESATEVVKRAPDHVAALALVAEVHASSGRLAEAGEALVQLAQSREAPAVQRKVARLGAIDVFDLRLHRPDRALEQIEALVAADAADGAIIERAVVIATRAELWDPALRFAKLAAERAVTPEARAPAMLRVGALYRDRLHDPEAARGYARQAHEAFPANLEILRMLQELSDPDERPRHARRSIEALREAMKTGPIDVPRLMGLGEAAHSGGDGVLERASQRLARALGGERTVPALGVPTGASLRDPALVLRYRHPADSGRAVTLFESVLPDLAGMVGLSTDGFHVGRSDRLKGANPVRAALEPFVAAAGFSEFELYVGGPDERRIAVIPGDPHAIVLGRGVAVPLAEASRFELVRWLLLSARGVAPLASEGVDASVANVLAALAYAEAPITGGTHRFEARLKPVAKAVSRRVRKAIADSGRALAAGSDPWAELANAARVIRATARRGALAVSGAVAPAYEDLLRTEGLPASLPWAQALDANAWARELALFAIGDAMAQIAREVGVDRG